MIVFFFFKQKTAYEMRISDWSSDVLLFRSGREVAAQEPRQGDEGAARAPLRGAAPAAGRRARRIAQEPGRQRRPLRAHPHLQLPAGPRHRPSDQPDALPARPRVDWRGVGRTGRPADCRRPGGEAGRVALSPARSDEHTFELQSLLRFSYAVICLNTQDPDKYYKLYIEHHVNH